MSFSARALLTTGSALALSDLCALLAATACAYAVRLAGGGDLPLAEYLGLLPILPLFLLLYAVLGLYPGILRTPSEELKQLSLGTSLGFLFLSLVLFLGQQGVVYSRFVIIGGWLLALALVPLFRYGTRKLCSQKRWWGYPLILFTPPGTDEADIRRVFPDSRSGLFFAGTVRLTEDGAMPSASEAARICLQLKAAHPDAMACIIAGTFSQKAVQELILALSHDFRRILIRLDASWLNQSSLRLTDSPFGPALTMRQNLLDPARMRVKRCLDLLLCFAGLPLCLVLFPLIILYVRTDSPGPVFFRHKRIGRNGRPFYAYKFRTMVEDASKVLREALVQDETLRDEWRRTRKLVCDPRLTRAGRFLRRSSLDELPQLWNVVKGEMSLVGPRPIVEKEAARYGEAFELYCRVQPGLTGLWQVSGRNDLSYNLRVELDRYYVYNWSVWLDIHIIIRTLPALIGGKGAY